MFGLTQKQLNLCINGSLIFFKCQYISLNLHNIYTIYALYYSIVSLQLPSMLLNLHTDTLYRHLA